MLITEQFSNLLARTFIIKVHFSLWKEINYSHLASVEEKANGDTQTHIPFPLLCNVKALALTNEQREKAVVGDSSTPF